MKNPLMDLPSNHDVYESDVCIHIVPDDCFPHELDEFEGCWCKIKILNKESVEESIERPIYLHHHSGTIVRLA